MKKLLLSFFLSFCVMSFVFAQDKVISGKITTQNAEPIPGASVSVKGSPATGTQTDASGTYKLSVPANAKTLIISFIGYKSQP